MAKYIQNVAESYFGKLAWDTRLATMLLVSMGEVKDWMSLIHAKFT